MKYLKALGLSVVLLVVAAVGTASATTFTSPAGTTVSAGTVLKAELSEASKLTGPWGEVSCSKSNIEGKVTNAGGSTETAKVELTALSFGECNCHTTVLARGVIEFHLATTPNGTMTATGQEITELCTPSGIHCIYKNATTHLGRIIGGSPAVLTIEAVVPRVGGTSGVFCGSTGSWTATYKVTAPTSLYVD